MTTVNIQVTDSAGQVWSNGSVAAQLQTSFGQLLNVVPIQATLDANGSASISLTANITISPAGSQWLITVCPAATASCFSQPVTITGTTQTLAITPPAIVLNLSTGQASTLPIRATAYNASEIIGAQLGSIYYDLTLKQLMVLTAAPNTWSPVTNSGLVTTISMVADGVTDNLSTLNAALVSLGNAGGTIVLVPKGTGTCYVSGTLNITTPSVVLQGTSWNNQVANSGTTLLFAAGVPGIKQGTGATTTIIKNLSIASKDTGPVSGDNGIWVQSSSIRLENVYVKNFGGNGVLFDSSGGGNCDHWIMDQVRCYVNFGDGFHFVGGADSNVGVATGCSATGNSGWGWNFVSGCISNTFVNPHADGNGIGGYNLGTTSSNLFLNVYCESSSVSSFVVGSGSDNNRVFFCEFGQPTTISNAGGNSNQFFYNFSSNVGIASSLSVLPPVGTASANGVAYSFTNGIFNSKDWTLSVSDSSKGFSGTLLDYNYPLSALYSLGTLGVANFNAATSSGGLNSPFLNFYSPFWTGSASSTDLWQLRTVGGSGANGSSRLSLTHSGTSGSATFGTPNAVMTGTTPTVAASEVGFGNSTASTVGSAGGASALPATPSGYLVVNIAGTNFKIPYFAN